MAASEFELRRQVQVLSGMLERIETEHIVMYGPDGEPFHPDWCRECRVSVLLALLWMVMNNRRGHIRSADE